ncbi:LOW QUALITY PROTEIN: uncharacterized protein LOC133847750 [Drosophila sulfurigaster albostrigata]|uniref:LOW QUALITY PROTEIN: uncharacterized protein LOC133847750 n=1 Tax=Drosophila sulfurigaster albostrigata TaxID=89887 RepID=UPI002D2198D1|nr:LOW QUALITY PROTEIN: uncharacterized protein LOC133847750 [Drosophila sulfurigaster albostrigata]
MMLELPDVKPPPELLMEVASDLSSIKSEPGTTNDKPKPKPVHCGKNAAAFETERLLIQLVSEQPALYNSRHLRFKDDAYKELLWQLIANKVGKESSNCMSLWAELRHRYQRHVQRRRRRHCIGKRYASLLHEEQMLFLYPHVARMPLQRQRPEHQQTSNDIAHDDNDDDDEVTIVAPQPAIIIDVDKVAIEYYKLNAEQLRLIDAVRAYPQLYDVRHAAYWNHRHRGLIWGAISNELHEKATKLMKSWLQLQIRYEWELLQQHNNNTTTRSRLSELLEFLEPHVPEQMGSVCKLSLYLRTAWHDPIEHFRSVMCLIQVLYTVPELTQMVEDYQHSEEKPPRYEELWLSVAAQVQNASHQRCEVTWLVLRHFYRELSEMRKVGYQLQDKWFFENIISAMYKQQFTRQARPGRKRAQPSSSPPLQTLPEAMSDELATENDDGPKGLAAGEPVPPLPLAIVYPMSSKTSTATTSTGGSDNGCSNENSNHSISSNCSSTTSFVLPRIDADISVLPPATNEAVAVPVAVAVAPPSTSIISVVPNSSLFPPGSDKANNNNNSNSSGDSNANSDNKLNCSDSNNINEPGIVTYLSKKSPKSLTVRNDKVPMPTSRMWPTATIGSTTVTAMKNESAATAVAAATTSASSATATSIAKKTVIPIGTTLTIATVQRNTAENNSNNTNNNTSKSTSNIISINSSNITSNNTNNNTSNNSSSSSSNSISNFLASRNNSGNFFNIRSSSGSISIHTNSASNSISIRSISNNPIKITNTNNKSKSNTNSVATSSSSASAANSTPAAQLLRVEFRDCPSNGRMLHVTGNNVPIQANFNMSRTALFIREVMAVPQLHSKEPHLTNKINDLWSQLAKKFHLPDDICRGIWTFLSHNINLFPQIAPMVDLMRPFKSTLKVWEKSHRLFSKFDEIARKYEWMLHKHELPALMQHFKRYEHLYWELRRPRPGESANSMRPPREFTEQERHDVWREAKENFPQMNHRDVWSMFKFAFKTYMEDLERGIENPWPQNWWHALEQLKFLVNVRYHPLDPYYYIVHNKFMEEVKRCSMYEALMQPQDDDDDADERRSAARHKMPPLVSISDPMPWETEEAKRLLVGDLHEAINVQSEAENESETESEMETEADLVVQLPEEQSPKLTGGCGRPAKAMEVDGAEAKQPVVELAQFIGNDDRQLPSVNGFLLTESMRRHRSAFSVANTAEKRAAWIRISRELRSSVTECRLSFQHMLREQRVWRISDPSGRCTMSTKYYRHMTDIYREVMFAHNAHRVSKQPDEREETIFPERYVPEISALNCEPQLVLKNWSYAIAHFPLVIQEELRSRLRFIFSKYERLGKLRGAAKKFAKHY